MLILKLLLIILHKIALDLRKLHQKTSIGVDPRRNFLNFFKGLSHLPLVLPDKIRDDTRRSSANALPELKKEIFT